MKIDCVHFYVEDAVQVRRWFVEVLAFQRVAQGGDRDTAIEIVRSEGIIFVLAAPRTLQSPVARFLEQHPPGVADVMFATPDLETFLRQGRSRSLILPTEVKVQKYSQGYAQWCEVVSIAGIKHTLIERHGLTPILPQYDLQYLPLTVSQESLFVEIDHVVLNVAAGQLQTTVDWYVEALGFERQQWFDIHTPRSGLYSQVLVHPQTGARFPINEPTSARSQIQEFLNAHRGAGIQHIALKTRQIIPAVSQLQQGNVAFLDVPQTYYEQLRARSPDLPLKPWEWDAIAQLNILVDRQPRSQRSSQLLLQIFTQPIFEQPTFFFEIIERRDRAEGFGEGNFQALFEAIERQGVTNRE
ncbi:MAG: 4-hydroxyphenylpyruvate dioxygenase [Jaaginema sp. PMC 1079.18]|nr:4-hydroxyphenylpyruvate dioxygenase [Jaaginema sp. PMC 1080.18]MEC4852255.1 4-hydroxyphenylpyruvate dioxygenase [Jaaginema sp. PMC 1079.18]MEC4865811.1 4-hydroxyphenylpyruvate dioxygenase [Jaaginema sp. PMC 1078.18]